MNWKYKLFLLALAIFMVGSTTWFGWQHYQAGVRDGEKTIKISEQTMESAKDFYLSSAVTVPAPFSITFTGDEDWIEVEIVSENYGTGESFLFRVSVGEEQVGIVYFDEDEHIQFDGDKEKFERALLKVLRARVEFFTAVEKEK